MKSNNLIIIGTSHISKQSLFEVKQAFEKYNPDIVALELDRQRMTSLLKKSRQKITLAAIKKIGFKGFLFFIIGAWAQKKLGKLVGISPGSEMKQAIHLARKNHKQIALIDQNIEVTLKKFSKSLTWKEKLNFIADVLKSVFLGKREIDFDLTKVPSSEIITKLIEKVKKRYPSVYRVLIEERNQVMALNLSGILKNNPDKKVLAIVGAGHEKEILRLVDEHLNARTN